MRPMLLTCLFAALPLAVPAARAQSLVSEQVEGNYRVCNYGGAHGLLSGTASVRQYRVGLAENCPVAPPVNSGTRPAPPTAALRSEAHVDNSRVCTYEQWGSRWSFTLPEDRACPPAAGMVRGILATPADPARAPVR